MPKNTTKDQVLSLFFDNTTEEISAHDVRDFVNAIWEDSERNIHKLQKISDIYSNNKIFQGELVTVSEETTNSENGI